MEIAKVGVEDARKILGDLVNAAHNGGDIVLTRHGKPVARLIAYDPADGVSFTERYDGDISLLAMSVDMDQTLRDVLDEHDDRHEINDQINDRITAKLQQHGVSKKGEWLGEWSAEQIVRDILAANGVTCPTPRAAHIAEEA